VSSRAAVRELLIPRRKMETSNHNRFSFKEFDDLRAELERRSLDIPLEKDLSVLSKELVIAGRRVPNRFAVQPMEGFDAGPDGSPGKLTFRRYTRYARGGFGLIWLEATAVLNEARSNPGQLWINKGNMPVYRDLVREVRKAAKDSFGRDIVLIVQLTHSGRYSKPTGIPKPIIAHHSQVLDPLHQLPPDYPLVTDDYLDKLQDIYVEAAGLAAEAGFDGVDIKSCHRYLVSELLASFTREGKYGGSFENRTRLLRETLVKVRKSVPSVFVTTRMNAYDAISYPYGFGVDKNDFMKPDLSEPIELVRSLQKIGIPILNISIGNPYYNPHIGRPYDFPIFGAPKPNEHPLVGLSRFMDVTRKIQESVPDLPIIGSGYSWLRHLMPHVAAAVIKRGGASLIGIGRGAFAYPDSVKDILEKGKMDPAKCCVTCSACTQIMRDGTMTGCVVRDKEIYGPQYRLGRRFAVDRLREEAKRCRDCLFATCSMGCPAHVDVPAFVKAFADGDIAKAYDVLRTSNVLPEMCAYVCPSEVQCEGACLEETFCKKPIPIRDIQLVVCRLARRSGLTGLKLPKEATGKKIAIVGGGPTGVAASIKLLEAGHNVIIFERGKKLGGTPDSIIPAERYAEAASEIAAILEPARKSGRLETVFGKELGKDLTLDDLTKKFDAVLLAVGLGGAMSLGKADGVMDALVFLRRIKTGELKSVPDKVAVLGGGNTAMDAAVTAIEKGAKDVYLVYRRSFAEMPAWPEERDRFMEKGGHCLILTQPLGYEVDAKGRLTGLKIARTELAEPDASGRRKPVTVAGSESVMKVAMVIEALGQGVPDEIRTALKGVTLTHSGFVATRGEDAFATNLKKVFAAGDLVNGGTTVVRCVAEGMQAAIEIGSSLK
jgi:2,4-dienoyl-CoA reductase (NADPH2)